MNLKIDIFFSTFNKFLLIEIIFSLHYFYDLYFVGGTIMKLTTSYKIQRI